MDRPRLNWGCGPVRADGWRGSDIADFGQHHVGDILTGLPWDEGSFDGVVANHALQALAWPDVVPALLELRRVLVVGGWLRVMVPDMPGAVRAWERGDRTWPGFAAIAEPMGFDERFCRYLVWGGHNRTLFTPGYLISACRQAGFTTALRATYGVTRGPDWMTDLDSRPGESIIVEAR